MNQISIREVDVNAEDAVILREELSDVLTAITGRSGKGGFHEEDMNQAKAAFVVAYDGETPCGCGAIRPRSAESAEIKRIYSKKHGVGAKIVNHLEALARNYGYQRVILSTATVNENAIRFYQKIGYMIIENYDEYKTRTNAVCFEKWL